MAHLWQHHHGKPGRGRYHNREWAARMKEIGLHPSSTGQEGGDETGDGVQPLHPAGRSVRRAAHTLLTRGFSIQWTEKPRRRQSCPVEEEAKTKKNRPKSAKAASVSNTLARAAA